MSDVRKQIKRAKQLSRRLETIVEELQSLPYAIQISEDEYINPTYMLELLADEFIEAKWDDKWDALLGQLLSCAVAGNHNDRFMFLAAWAREEEDGSADWLAANDPKRAQRDAERAKILWTAYQQLTALEDSAE